MSQRWFCMLDASCFSRCLRGSLTSQPASLKGQSTSSNGHSFLCSSISFLFTFSLHLLGHSRITLGQVCMCCPTIRPKLEYASIVWNPHLKCIIKDMEKVQKFALKVCLKQWDYSISYLELLKRAELPTLGQRRALASLHHLFKIMYNISYYEDTPKKRQLTYNTRHVNNLSLTPVSCITSVHSNSFFPRTIELWNRIMANCELIISTCTPLSLCLMTLYST